MGIHALYQQVKYEKTFSQIYATLWDTSIKKNFFTNIGRSLGHFYKKNFSHEYSLLSGTLL